VQGGGFILMGEYFSTSKKAGLGTHDESGVPMSLHKASTISEIQHAPGTIETHDQETFRVLVLYGLTENITILGSVPYAFNRIEEGGETETSSGFADPEVTAIADVMETEEGDFELNATVMARLPLGSGDQRDASGVRLDQHLQPGTGAWSAAVGIQAAHPMLAVPIYYGISYQVNGTNSNDFSYGDVLRVNIATQVPIGRSVQILAEGNTRYAEKDREGAATDENSGGWVLYLSPGVRVSLPAGFAIRGQVQIPIVEDLYGIQDEKVNVQLGLSIEP